MQLSTVETARFSIAETGEKNYEYNAMKPAWWRKYRAALRLGCAVCCAGALAAGCRTPQIHGTIAGPKPPQYETLTHQIVRTELKDDKNLPERLALLDKIIAESVAELDKLPSPKNEKEKARQFFSTVDRVIVCNNFIFPPVGLVDLVSDALKPTNHLSAESIDKALGWYDNGRRQEQIEDNARRNGTFYVSDCDTTAMLYLAVAEAKGYPCFLVEVPGHAFVRWDSKTLKMNWDANMGVSYSDAHYRWHAHLAKGDHRVPFLKSLNHDETVGYWLSVLGLTDENRGAHAGAAQELERAEQLFPTDPDVLDRRAWFLATCDDAAFRNGPLALQIARQEVDGYPDPMHLDTLAAAYAECGDFAQATATEQQAVYVSGTWDRSEYDSDQWPDFQEYVDVYANKKTYAQYNAELTTPLVYTQTNEAKGILIKAPAAVDPRALVEAAFIVSNMLQRQDIIARMSQRHAALAIIPRHAYVTCLPDFASLRGQHDASGNAYDSFDIRGLGAARDALVPVSATSEENLLHLDSDPFWTPLAASGVTYHQFGHTIMNVGFSDEELVEWKKIYDNAKKRNLFPGKFAMKSANEYWAELSSAFFGANPDIRRHAVRRRDPAAYKFLESVYCPDK